MNTEDDARARLIGLLPDDVPLQEMIRLTDSILASPIQIVVVDNQSENGQTLIDTLHERSGDLLEVVALDGRNPLSLYPGFVEDPETPEDAALFLEHGVPGIFLKLWLSDEQTMSETISYAREYRQAILDALAEDE